MTELIQGLEPASLYEYQGQKLTISSIVWIVLCIVFVGLRVYTRRLVKAGYSADNFLCFAALASQLATAGLAIGSVQNGGVGHHEKVVAIPTLVTFGKYLFAISLIYVATINFAKFAILTLYYRIFARDRGIKMAIFAIGFVMAGQTISTTIALIAACQPVAANWNPTLLLPPTNGHCVDKEQLFRWVSFPGIIVDLSLLILPLPVIAKLNVNKRLKVSLAVTFLIGSFGLVGSCIRFSQFYQVQSFVDATYNAPDLIIWTEVEGGVYLISACLMTFKPLLEKISKASIISRPYGAGRSGEGSSRGKQTWKDYVKPSGKSMDVNASGNSDYPLHSVEANAGFQRLPDDKVHVRGGRAGGGDGITVTTEIYTAGFPRE